MERLTLSGAGALLLPGTAVDSELAPRIRDLLDEHRFVVLKSAFKTGEEAVELLSYFGTVNRAAERDDGTVVVEDGDSNEVFRSNNALPLHKDGVLTGFDVPVVGICCLEFKNVTGGRTCVSDAKRALARVPLEEVDVLRTNGIEVMAVDRSGYYRTEFEGKWIRFPAFKERIGKGETLNLGLPHAEGEPESWRMRVADVSPELSDKILSSLRAAFLSADYTYMHAWDEGDLLVMDNDSTLHGREAFTGGPRRLANIQVIATPG